MPHRRAHARTVHRTAIVVPIAFSLVLALAATSSGGDRPFGTSRIFLLKWAPMTYEVEAATAGQTGSGGAFSKKQIEAFRCESGGDPTDVVDLSCNVDTYGQAWAPDNEIAIAVDPEDPDHLLAGSNDYYYRFNNATGARQALVPTGFFTSFDGGETWIDGQIPVRSGNGAGDPAPAFDAKHDVALMAQLENVVGNGGFWVSQGDVSVSRSTDGGVTWQPPVTVMKGTGAGIGPANQAVFWDKEYITVNNYPGTPSYGRIVVTATKFINGIGGSYHSSAIWMSHSDNGGRTWSAPMEISGKNPDICEYQETGPDDGSCDEDQFSYPEFGPDGSLWVHFANGQHESEWESEFEFDTTIMVVKAPPTNGAPSFTDPVPVVDIEDGASDMPWSVIGRQTIWGHQIRWTGIGTISVDPTEPDNAAIVYAVRDDANPNATEGCTDEAPTADNDYDPCDAGPGSDTDVYLAETDDGGATWTTSLLDDAGGRHQWFAWVDHLSDGRLAVAWDEDTTSAPADTFRHVLWVEGEGKQTLGSDEHVDVSVTHWAGQYTTAWPEICGPAGYTEGGEPAEGKDCNVFHGDYTGLAVDPDDRVHVVWTGLNRNVTSPQIDGYTGEPHDGYAQDAMYARRGPF